MKTTTYILIFVFLNIFGTKTLAAKCLDNSHSPILVLPSAKIAPGMDTTIIELIKKYYHHAFLENIPTVLQHVFISSCHNLTILNSSYFISISKGINYTDDPLQISQTIRAMRISIARQVKTVALMEIDSEGASRIVLRVKAINVLDNSIIAENKIKFSITEIENFEKKIRQLAKKILCSYNRIGFGIGYQINDQINLENITGNIRRGRPHNDDLNRSDILDPNIPDNYFIFQNKAEITLPHRFSFDVNFRFWGFLNIAIKTTQIKSSAIKEGNNYFRKNYIEEGSTHGDALIYYFVKSKDRSFFDANSFSLPIYATYPILDFGKKHEFTIRLLIGTNFLLPKKIEFEAEKGWHRYNARKPETTFDMGELKETEFFGGIDIEGEIGKFYSVGIQFQLVYKEYNSNFKEDLSLQKSSNLLPTFNLNFARCFDSTLLF